MIEAVQPLDAGKLRIVNIRLTKCAFELNPQASLSSEAELQVELEISITRTFPSETLGIARLELGVFTKSPSAPFRVTFRVGPRD